MVITEPITLSAATSTYTLVERIRKLWADESRFGRWAKVERAVTSAWASDAGGHAVPERSALAISRARFDIKAIDEYERETHHDVIAFLRSMSDSMGSEDARWLHYGLTSSDVVDTALGLALVGTIDTFLNTPIPHRCRPKCSCTYVGKELIDLRDRVGYGQLSGPVGTHATLPSAVEEHALGLLGLKPQRVSSQVLGRDIHADYTSTLARMATIMAEECAEKEPTAQLYSQQARAQVGAMLESIALWHERDISQSSVERLCLPTVSIQTAHTMMLWVESRRDSLG